MQQKKSLKIVFMGTPEFAVASLDILYKYGYDIAAVITSSDKPAGRGQQIQTSAVKDYAVEKGLRILQPEKLKNSEFLSELKSIGADLQIVVAFRMLPEAVWNMPPLGTINLHASLLPQYRGAAPINWAIINGEKETGVTTFFLQHEIDTGKIIMQERVAIGENETAGELHDRLKETGAQTVLRTVEAIVKDDIKLKDQEELALNIPLKAAPKIFKDDCLIDWNAEAANIHNFIRGLSPYPSAWTELKSPTGEKFHLKVFSARADKKQHSHLIKHILTDGKTYIKIAVTDGYIELLTLQLAGKKKMNVPEFLRGFNLTEKYLLA